MRRTLLLLALLASSASAAQAQSDTCSVDGVWQEKHHHWTTRFAKGRWQTWGGSQSLEAKPVIQGWMAVHDQKLVFDYDSGQAGYAYTYGFDADCSVLHMFLGTDPNAQGLHVELHRQ